MNRADALRALSKAAREFASAIEASWRAAEKRAALGTDCTRAQMTTANARWETLAEERDRKQAAFDAALAACAGESHPTGHEPPPDDIGPYPHGWDNYRDSSCLIADLVGAEPAFRSEK